MDYVLGVDLGTTYSAAAIGADGRVEIFQLGIRQAAIPSVVTIRDDGVMLVGEVADRHADDPSRVAREFKRRLGDTTPLLLGGVPYGAETLTARLLEWIVERVRAERGQRESVVALTYPAGYGRYKLSFLEEAARLVGVSPLQLVSEPVAAALDYAATERVAKGELLAVYDFGGGTLDVALVRKDIAGFDVVGTPEGMERFGGSDLDEAVFGHVLASLGDSAASLDVPDLAQTTALAALRVACRDAKEALSFTTDVTIPVLLPGAHTEVRLTRAEFEAMLRPRLADTVQVLERSVYSAGATMGDVSRILLVGGASRIPLVAETIGQATGRPVVLDANPKHAVALGAARFTMGQPEAAMAERAEVSQMPSAGSGADGAGPPAETTPALEGVSTARPSGPRGSSGGQGRRRMPRAILAVGALAALMLGGIAIMRMPSGSAPPPGSETPSILPSTSSGVSSPASTGQAPVVGRVAALYRLDYGLPTRDGDWYAWAAAPDAAPPEDLASDFYPRSDPYSSTDPALAEVHLAQLAEAGVGVVAAVWDPPAKGPQQQAVEALMRAAERSGGRVLFWIDVTGPAKLDSASAALEQLLGTYAKHPATYVTSQPFSWSDDTLPKPVVILAGIDVASAGEAPPPEEWRQLVADTHRRWRAVVLAGTQDVAWLEAGQFDGLAGHASGSADAPSFGWADGLPVNAWYAPVVLPGRTSERVGGGPPPLERAGGETYRMQWAAAATAGHTINLLLIDSFNAWSAGTQIEPARAELGGLPRSYQTYEPLGPDGYLELTRRLSEELSP